MRRGVIVNFLTIVFVFAAPECVWAQTKKSLATLIEVAPLRSSMGQLSLRAEGSPLEHISVALSYEQTSVASTERAAFYDTSNTAGFEVLWYPVGQKDYPVFLASGVKQERAIIGRAQPRYPQTWARIRPEEAMDLWQNEDIYTSATQSVGYRIFAAGLLTLGARLDRDELIAVSSRARRHSVHNEALDLKSAGREQIRHRVALFAGLYLP